MGEPPAAGADFSTRLSEAVARRGLSLARIKAHLAQVGLDVSVATLSYWTSGRSRPARSRSLEVVRALEAILVVEEGWLVDAMVRGPRSYHLSQVMGEDALAPEELKGLELPSASQWQPLMSYRRIIMDDEGRERRFEIRNLVMAKQDGARQWSVVVQHRDGTRATPDTDSISRLERETDLGHGIWVYVFAFDEPLARGQLALTSHSLEIHDAEEPITETGIAVDQQIGHLLIEMVFGRRRPRSITLRLRHPGAVDEVPVNQPVLMSGTIAQCVLAQAPAGLYTVRVDW